MDLVSNEDFEICPSRRQQLAAAVHVQSPRHLVHGIDYHRRLRTRTAHRISSAPSRCS